MSSEDFEYLIQKIGLIVTKTDTNMRKAIPVQERLAVTLRFLATGDSFTSLSYLFKFSTQTVSRCVQEVCQALNQQLKDEIKVKHFLFLFTILTILYIIIRIKTFLILIT